MYINIASKPTKWAISFDSCIAFQRKRPHIQINFGKYKLVFWQSTIFGCMDQYMINVFIGIWWHVYIEYTSMENMFTETEKSMNEKNGTFPKPSRVEDIL